MPDYVQAEADYPGQKAPDFPEELYAVHPFDLKWIATNFDALPEGAQVGIYVLTGIATVKVRREALLIDEENNKVLRSSELAAPKL